MCSIFGACGHRINDEIVRKLRLRAADRGRDGGRMEWYPLSNGRSACLGNWRATPTPEAAQAPLQPYDRLVHNGTIANDKELGSLPGQVDSEILPKVLNRRDIYTMALSLLKVKGSYAIATIDDASSAVILATNYKPIYYWSPDVDTFYFSSMLRHFVDITPCGQHPVPVDPYTVLNLVTGETWAINRQVAARAVVIASSGLDSTVVATHYVKLGYDVCLLHFRYGCRAEPRETERIMQLANFLSCTYHFIDLDYGAIGNLSPLINRSSDIARGISGAEFAHEWVPARNLVMLAMAAAYAEENGYHVIALGNNLEESGAYPDNEEEMTYLMNRVMDYAVHDGYSLAVESPVGHLMKHEIVRYGMKIHTPFHLTWSCYHGGEEPCHNCGPCFMREEAFRRNGSIDPLIIEEKKWLSIQ